MSEGGSECVFVLNSTAAIEAIGNRTQNSSSRRTRVLPLHHGLGEFALCVMLRVSVSVCSMLTCISSPALPQQFSLNFSQLHRYKRSLSIYTKEKIVRCTEERTCKKNSEKVLKRIRAKKVYIQD